MDLWVCDGVEDASLIHTREDDLGQLLPVDLAVGEQDLRAEMQHDPAVGRTVGLHH